MLLQMVWHIFKTIVLFFYFLQKLDLHAIFWKEHMHEEETLRNHETVSERHFLKEQNYV